MNKLRVLSLFSGIGAFEKALTNIGVDFELVNYCEIDKFASKAFAAIHEVDELLNLGDISKVDEKTIADIDLMTYGFPCQDISSGGLLKGIIQGETRSGLLYEALRIAEHKKPRYLIAENVKNLVGSRFKSDFESLLKRLEDMGYRNYWKVLKATDYGIPQTRERVFIVSIRSDISQDFHFPNKIELNVLTEDLIGDDYRDVGEERIAAVRNSSYRSRQFYDSKKPCPTLAARDWKDSGKYFFHRGKYVKSDAIAHWRLMGFSDEDFYKAKLALNNSFYNGSDKSNTQLFKQAGNSIVVTKLEALLAELLSERIGNVQNEKESVE
jgi:site-specific DNA-cytosine methylase